MAGKVDFVVATRLITVGAVLYVLWHEVLACCNSNPNVCSSLLIGSCAGVMKKGDNKLKATASESKKVCGGSGGECERSSVCVRERVSEERE